MARSSLGWAEAGISPISSRKRVPPSASSKRPGFLAAAPVKAPFSCPKSSLSIKPSGMAAQLILTNGSSARGLCKCTLRATSSLPVPLSPLISTVAEVGATRSIIRFTAQSAGLRPISRRSGSSSGWMLASLSSSFRVFTALATTWQTSSGSNGLVMKSNAPCLSASTALPTVPWAVSRITGTPGACLRASSSSSSPFMWGILRSVRMASTGSSLSKSRAASPSGASSVRSPSRCSSALSTRRIFASSSTIRTVSSRFTRLMPRSPAGPPGTRPRTRPAGGSPPRCPRRFESEARSSRPRCAAAARRARARAPCRGPWS